MIPIKNTTHKNTNYSHYKNNNIKNHIQNNTQEESTLLPNTISTNTNSEEIIAEIKLTKANSFSKENKTKTKEIIKDIYVKLLENFKHQDISNKIICKTSIDSIKTKIINTCNNKNPSNNKLTKKDFQVEIEGQNIKKYIQNQLRLDDKSFKKAFTIAETQILKEKLNNELKKDQNELNFEIELSNNKILKSNVNHLIDTNPSILKEYIKVMDRTSTIIKFFIKFSFFRKFIQFFKLTRFFNLESLLEINNQFITSIKNNINENNVIDIDDPINLYQHTIEINNNTDNLVNQKSDKKSIIRNGHIHNLAAAKKYLNEMLKLQTSILKDKAGYQILIDNRLMYDTNFRESELISNHIKFINEAIEEHNKEHSDNKLRILNFNLQPQYLFGIHTSNTQQFIEFNNIIEDSETHKALITSDYKYKFIYNMLESIIENDFFTTGGEKAYNLGFIIQYIATSNNIPFSEGCKSNKDRGSMKKLNDEWFYAKLNLLSIEELNKLNFENFFKLDNTNYIMDPEI